MKRTQYFKVNARTLKHILYILTKVPKHVLTEAVFYIKAQKVDWESQKKTIESLDQLVYFSLCNRDLSMEYLRFHKTPFFLRHTV